MGRNAKPCEMYKSCGECVGKKVAIVLDCVWVKSKNRCATSHIYIAAKNLDSVVGSSTLCLFGIGEKESVKEKDTMKENRVLETEEKTLFDFPDWAAAASLLF